MAGFDTEAISPAEALEIAKGLVFVRPLVPYPGWVFAADWDNPDLAFRLRRRIWEYFNQRQLEAPLVFDWYKELRLNLWLGNDLSRQVFIGGCSEPNEFFFLHQILGPGMVFIDAGANDGLYSMFAARCVGPTGQVWAFEPSEREFARLEQGLTLNHLQNVRTFRVALADRNGEENLVIAGYGHEGQNTLGSFVYEGVDQVRSESVAVRRLDDLVYEANLAKVDVIKVDVEGAEHRVLEGARRILRQCRPTLLFEVLDPALRKQASSRDKLLTLVTSLQYRLFVFDQGTGLPTPAGPGCFSDNMIAIPVESPLAIRFAVQEPGRARSAGVDASAPQVNQNSLLPEFTPARAYWNQRVTLAGARDRILSLSRAVDQPTDLWPYQWAQLMAVVMEYEPDLILELGRDRGNSTCAFTEASNLKGGRSRVLSLCLTHKWERETLPRLRQVVPDVWFAPLQTVFADILDFDFAAALSGAKRILIFWDAHGFKIAERVLGEILPMVAGLEHLVIMHDLSDVRYSSEQQLDYGGYGLWKGQNAAGPRLKLGIIDSAVAQSVAALDFATRNHITLNSADDSIYTGLSPDQQAEMQSLLGELFNTQAHWFYFTLNERPSPYRFPRYTHLRRSRLRRLAAILGALLSRPREAVQAILDTAPEERP